MKSLVDLIAGGLGFWAACWAEVASKDCESVHFYRGHFHECACLLKTFFRENKVSKKRRAEIAGKIKRGIAHGKAKV